MVGLLRIVLTPGIAKIDADCGGFSSAASYVLTFRLEISGNIVADIPSSPIREGLPVEQGDFSANITAGVLTLSVLRKVKAAVGDTARLVLRVADASRNAPINQDVTIPSLPERLSIQL